VVCLTHRAASAFVPSYSLTPIDIGQNANNVVLAPSLNDAGQVAVEVLGPSPFQGVPLRLNADGSITRCNPPGAYVNFIMSDGRLICDFDEPNGLIGYCVGDETGSTNLTYPSGLPMNGMAANAATDADVIVGGASGYLVTWSGPDLKPSVLGRLGNANTTALATSRNGQYYAGVARTDDADAVPFVYTNGTFTSIDIPGYTNAVATGVNNDGTVIGYALDYAHNIRRGFTWRNGVLSWLNPLDSFVYSDPESINDNGLIVGQGSPNAMLWDADGTAYLLDDLCNAAAMEDGVGYAYSINDSNQIIGAGGGNAYPGETVPFLLNPIAVPEPASAVMLLTAFPLLAARRNYGRSK
jgi:probable HAF family extracellular repeat protein